MSENTLKLEVLKQFADNKIFVETGTHQGKGVEVALAAGFEKIISIESDPDYFHRAVEKFKINTNVILVLGDGGIVLPQILEEINQQVTFWLDAHYSVGESFHKDISSCPILDELSAVAEHDIKTHTILIDDMRYFRLGINQWNNIKLADILVALKKINEKYVISYEKGSCEKDILVAKVRK